MGYTVTYYNFHSTFSLLGDCCKGGGKVQGEGEISGIVVFDVKFTKKQ